MSYLNFLEYWNFLSNFQGSNGIDLGGLPVVWGGVTFDEGMFQVSTICRQFNTTFF